MKQNKIKTMRTAIKLYSADVAVEVKETYQTIKRRLNENGMFIEVTDQIGKLTLAKKAVEWATIVDEKRVNQKKEVKNGRTS